MNAPAAPHVPFQDLPLQIRRLRTELDPVIDAVLNHCGFIMGKEVAEFERASLVRPAALRLAAVRLPQSIGRDRLMPLL